jgi:tRNA(fMet)-specific endonuclease VapC
MYLLDTNVCIQLLNNSSPQVTRRLSEHDPRSLYLCTIVQLELYYGAYKSTRKERNLEKLEIFFAPFHCVSLDKNSVAIAGKIRADLERFGTPIGPYDLQIAAIAIANGLTLITHNTREFGRIPELELEDWEG